MTDAGPALKKPASGSSSMGSMGALVRQYHHLADGHPFQVRDRDGKSGGHDVW